MREAELLKLDSICRTNGIILVIVRSYGLVGYLRVSLWPELPAMGGRVDSMAHLQTSLKEHCIIESKPDNQVLDLR
jgi:hypothetical protein